MVVSAWERVDCRVERLLRRVVERVESCACSDCRWERAEVMEECWVERGERAEWDWVIKDWRVVVRWVERVVRRASFWGLRGTGGAGREVDEVVRVVDVGRGMSKGEERRSGAGSGLGRGCGGGGRCCGAV